MCHNLLQTTNQVDPDTGEFSAVAGRASGPGFERLPSKTSAIVEGTPSYTTLIGKSVIPKTSQVAEPA